MWRSRALRVLLAATAFFLLTGHRFDDNWTHQHCGYDGMSDHGKGWLEARTMAEGTENHCTAVRANIGYYDGKGNYRYETSYRLARPLTTNVFSDYWVSNPVLASHAVAVNPTGPPEWVGWHSTMH